MESKKCSKSKIEKLKAEFEMKSLSKDRFQSDCKSRIVACNIYRPKIFQDNGIQYQHDYVGQRCAKVICY